MLATPASGALQVASSPRVTGARWGTKLTLTGDPAVTESSCSISAMCLWPVTAYGRRFSLTETKSKPSPVARPAPDTPDWASMWIPSALTAPAATSGASARMAAVG